ncbi:unnamed protein product, partial [Choristocarpus tenellus]
MKRLVAGSPGYSVLGNAADNTNRCAYNLECLNTDWYMHFLKHLLEKHDILSHATASLIPFRGIDRYRMVGKYCENEQHCPPTHHQLQTHQRGGSAKIKSKLATGGVVRTLSQSVDLSRLKVSRGGSGDCPFGINIFMSRFLSDLVA